MRALLDRLVDEMVHGGITLDEARRELERRFIQRVLAEHDGHLGHAADRLGIHRNTLTRKIDELRLKTR